MKNADMPAMPVPLVHSAGGIHYSIDSGLTKRELIAAMAMQGYCANSTDNFLSASTEEELAFMSVKAADALLAELGGK